MDLSLNQMPPRRPDQHTRVQRLQSPLLDLELEALLEREPHQGSTHQDIMDVMAEEIRRGVPRIMQ